MSKESELAVTIEILRTCAEAIDRAATTLVEHFGVKEVAPAETASVEPIPATPEITKDAVLAVLKAKSRAGHTAEVKALLQKHGADRFSAVDPVEYPALLKEAEAISNAT